MTDIIQRIDYCEQHNKLRMLCCPTCFDEAIEKAKEDCRAEIERLTQQVEAAERALSEQYFKSKEKPMTDYRALHEELKQEIASTDAAAFYVWACENEDLLLAALETAQQVMKRGGERAKKK